MQNGDTQCPNRHHAPMDLRSKHYIQLEHVHWAVDHHLTYSCVNVFNTSIQLARALHVSINAAQHPSCVCRAGGPLKSHTLGITKHMSCLRLMCIMCLQSRRPTEEPHSWYHQTCLLSEAYVHNHACHITGCRARCSYLLYMHSLVPAAAGSMGRVHVVVGHCLTLFILLGTPIHHLCCLPCTCVFVYVCLCLRMQAEHCLCQLAKSAA